MRILEGFDVHAISSGIKLQQSSWEEHEHVRDLQYSSESIHGNTVLKRYLIDKERTRPNKTVYIHL